MAVLTPETEARLVSLAASRGKTPEEIIQELLKDFDETDLVSEEWQQERSRLIAIQQSRAWTPEERSRFLELTNKIETAEAARLQTLATLARERGISLADAVRERGPHST
jgi:hypothetical protein